MISREGSPVRGHGNESHGPAVQAEDQQSAEAPNHEPHLNMASSSLPRRFFPENAEDLLIREQLRSDLMFSSEEAKPGIVKRLTHFTLISKPGPSDTVHVERRHPLGQLDPTWARIPWQFRIHLQDLENKICFSYYTKVESLTWLSTRERAELMLSFGKPRNICSVLKDPSHAGDNYHVFPRERVHGSTAYVIGASEVQDATAGDIGVLIAGDPVTILPELSNELASYRLLREDSIPYIAAKVVPATQVYMNGLDEGPSLLMLEIALRDIINDKFTQQGWLDRNYHRTEASIKELSSALQNHVCQAVYYEAQVLRDMDPTNNVDAAFQMIAIGSQLVPDALEILFSEISNRVAAFNHVTEETAKYVGKIATKAALAAATHGVSAIVEAATGDVASDAGGELFKMAVQRVLPNNLTNKEHTNFQKWCQDLNQHKLSLAARIIDPRLSEGQKNAERKANTEAARFIELYLHNVKSMRVRVNTTIQSVRARNTAILMEDVKKIRKPGVLTWAWQKVRGLFHFGSGG